VAALAALPIVLGAAGLAVLEAHRALDPRSELFSPPPAGSLAAALDGGDLLQAHALLRREPGALLYVSDPRLTGGASILVSPLLWAAATGNDDAVRMLLGMGQNLSRGADRFAACLARHIGKTHTAELLLAYGHPPHASCPALDSGTPPLVALLGPQSLKPGAQSP
jgi:hypothetical protein